MESFGYKQGGSLPRGSARDAWSRLKRDHIERGARLAGVGWEAVPQRGEGWARGGWAEGSQVQAVTQNLHSGG